MSVPRLRMYLPLIAFALMAVLLWRGLSLDPNYMPSALEGRAFPAFELPSLQGDTVTNSALEGDIALVNVWATWCPSCDAEHAYLNQLAQRGVRIIGINYKDDTDAARSWIRSKGDPYHLNIVDSDGRLGLDLGVTGAPETYLIDTAAMIRLRYQGPVDEDVWQSVLLPVIERLRAESRG